MKGTVAVVGSFVQDLAFRVESFAQTGETRIGGFSTGPGGKGSNQAVACHRQGVRTIFIGAIGHDLFGDGYRSWIAREGVSAKLLEISELPTGAASIVVNSRGENQIVVALGANDALTPEFVDAALESERELAIVLLQAESNLAAAAQALAHARRRELFSIFNPAPINPAVTSELIAAACCITPNETECAYLVERLTGKRLDGAAIHSLSDDEIRRLCAVFPVSSVVVTLGEHGSILYQQGEPARILQNVRRGDIVRVPALRLDPVDTTGAGDAFNGGLAAGLIRFAGDLPRALRYATVVAGLSTQRFGTAPAMPTEAEVARHAEFFSAPS